ncbi:hypothetical protein RSAG8_01932, partial [Rhizoctonia solani AG-8 WAC10335]
MKHHVGPGILASIAYFDPQLGSIPSSRVLARVQTLVCDLTRWFRSRATSNYGCATRLCHWPRLGRTLPNPFIQSTKAHTYIPTSPTVPHVCLIRNCNDYHLAPRINPANSFLASLGKRFYHFFRRHISYISSILARAYADYMRPDYLNGARLLSFGVFIALLIKINPNAGGVIVGELSGYHSDLVRQRINIFYSRLSPNLEFYIYPSVSSLTPFSSAQVSQHWTASLTDLPAPSTSDQSLTFCPLMNTKANASGSIETASVSSLSMDDELASPTGNNHPVTSRNYLNNSVWLITAHSGHATVDIVTSLLGFAVVINSA